MSAPRKLSVASSGVYRTPADVSVLRARAAASRAAWLNVDAGAAHDKAGLMTLLARALQLPPSFGANWDALADSLQDLSWRPAAGYVLHVEGSEVLRQALGEDWGRLLEVLQATARYWIGRGKPFVVIMDGAEELPSWT